MYVCIRSPGGVYGVTDGDHVAGSAHIQVGPSEGDQAWVGHGVLVPTDTTSPWSGHQLKSDTVSSH